MLKTPAITLTIWTTLLSGMANSAAPLDIRQIEYTYRIPVTREVTAQAFVLGSWPMPDKLSPPNLSRILATAQTLKIRSPEAASGSDAQKCSMPVVHFDLNSAEPLDFEGKVIESLQNCGITRATRFIVKGFTCDLGPEALNLALARKRAENVATLLNEHGFGKNRIEALGSANFVTHDPARRHLNRRVEIHLENLQCAKHLLP